MKSADNVPITFANLVLTRGLYNGVVNLSLGAFEFNPSDDEKTVEPSPVITARLRMDMPCAEALRDALIELTANVNRIGNGVAEAPEQPTEQSTDSKSAH